MEQDGACCPGQQASHSGRTGSEEPQASLCASPRPRQRAPPRPFLSRPLRHPRAATHSQRAPTSPWPGGLASTSAATIPHLGVGRGAAARAQRPRERARGAVALTFPGPPGWRRVIQQGPGRRRRARGWRRGELGPRWRPLQTSTATLDTHQATFWEPDSPPATAAAATAPAPASVMAGAAAEGERATRARGQGGGESRGWGRKPRAGEVGREEVREGEGTGRRERGRSEGAGGRAGEEAEGGSAAAEASRGRPPGPGSERGRSAGCAGREDFRGRNLPAPLQCVGPRRRPAGGGGGSGCGRWVAAEAAG